MPSKNPVTTYLGNEDMKLLETAEKLYRMGESELVREVLHNWLFNNKLQLTAAASRLQAKSI